MTYASISIFVVGIINTPLLFLNMIVNTFYAFCLIFPPHDGKRKQPVTVLLGFLVLCTIIYCVSLVMIGSYGVVHQDYQLFINFMLINSYFMQFSISTYVWLNFYYYLQIVPSQFAFFQWIKRNIKSTIHVILIIDSLLIISSRLDYQIWFVMCTVYSGGNDFSLNGTTWKQTQEQLERSRVISLYTVMVHFSLCTCVMVASSLSTACYLYRHTKSVGKNGSSFSAKRLRAQVRVTITGICQGVFFFLYACYILLSGFTGQFAGFKFNMEIFYSFTTLFISGSTVTLGIGQTTFKNRIVNVLQGLKNVGICQKN